MCGISGVFNDINRQDLGCFPLLLDSLYHRGPDENGIYSDDNVVLGSRRLSILDLESGKQPISSEDDKIWVVLNGEIYNYEELKETLQKKGHTFKTRTDTEVLVHLYEEEGEEFVCKLRGMFAFALYNKNKEQLLLARDRIGKKPLFYTWLGSKLLFASEIKAILKHPNIVKKPNLEALYHYFTLKHIPRPLTAFDGIYSLLPGEMMIAHNGSYVKKVKYAPFSFSSHEQTEEDVLIEENFLEKLGIKLKESVKLRVYASDVPVGAFLSGGLDSSLIVALMRQYAGGELHTFSLSYKDEENPDTPYARQMARLLGTTHHEYCLGADEIPKALPEIINSFDEPFGGVISTYFLSRLISKYVKVALSGDGADELFGSYVNHRLAWPVYYYIKGDNIWEKWINEKERVLKIAHQDQAVWRMKLYNFDDEIKREFLSRDFISHLNGASTLKLVQKEFKNIQSGDPLNQVLEVDIKNLLPNEVLHYVDHLSMVHSVEVRSPFLDQEVVSLATTIPGKYKITPNNTKEILKKLAAKYLPSEIINRPKKGFVLPFHKWLTGKLKQYALHMLSPQELSMSGLLKANSVSDIVEEHMQGKKDYTYGIFSLLMFQLWWQKHFK